MQEIPTSNQTLKKNEVVTFFVEFTVVLIVSFFAATIVFWTNYVASGLRQFTTQAIFEFTTYSLKLSFVLTLGYRISRWVVIKAMLQKFFFRQPAATTIIQSYTSYIWDIFIICALTITLYPLNPVFQDTAKSAMLPLFTIANTRFDFIPTLIALLVIAALVVLIQIIFIKDKKLYFNLAAPFILAIALSFINYGPNYDARIFETREAWKLSNTDLMITRANLALEAAKNTEEKSRAYYWMAVAYNIKELPLDALIFINKAIELNTQDASLYSVKAFSLVRLKKFDEALNSANYCVTLEPDYAWCYSAIARIYHDQGDIQKALIAQRKAQELDQSSPEIIEYLHYMESIKK